MLSNELWLSAAARNSFQVGGIHMWSKPSGPRTKLGRRRVRSNVSPSGGNQLTNTGHFSERKMIIFSGALVYLLSKH